MKLKKQFRNDFSNLVISKQPVIHSDPGRRLSSGSPVSRKYSLAPDIASPLAYVVDLAPPCSMESACQGGRFLSSGEYIFGCFVFFRGVVYV